MNPLLLICSILFPIVTTFFLNLLLTVKSNVPGHFSFPLVGESIDYFKKLRSGTNEKFVMRRKKIFGDVFKASVLGEQMAFLCGQGNKFLFSQENKLVEVWWPSSVESIIKKSHNKSVTAESAKVRQLLPPFLRANAVKNYVGDMDKELRQHLKDYWIGHDKVEVCPFVAKYTFALAVKLLLGVRDPTELVKLAKPFVDAHYYMLFNVSRLKSIMEPPLEPCPMQGSPI